MKSMIFIALFGAALISCVSAQIETNAVIVVYNHTLSTPDGLGGFIITKEVRTVAYTNFSIATNALQALLARGDSTNLTDVCSTTFHPCANDATCTNLDTSMVQCTCDPGFSDSSTSTFTTTLVPSGTTCTDIDECAGNTTVCGPQTASCTNSPGTYTCTCNTDYELNSAKVCADINECANATLNNCHVNATCTNTDPSFTCACDAGFTGDGVNCADINECVDFGYDCGPNGTCVDNIGSYTCTCNAGYQVNGTMDPLTCVDFDECITGAHTCDTNAICTNTLGGFTCACYTGYSGDGMTCTDIDECAGAHGCHANATCTNNPGSFDCSCDNGFTGNGISCEAVRLEYDYRAVISVSTAVTSSSAVIENAIEDFMDEIMNANSLFYHTVIATVERVTSGTPSEIIVLLAFNQTSHTADEFTALLRDHTGSAIMIDGGSLTGDDFSECTNNYGNCSASAMCTNTNGSFICSCNTGYTGDGVTCTDFNECVEFGYDCGPNGVCLDNVGSYTCTCDTGFQVNEAVDPKTCTDNNECALDGTCHQNADCMNSEGSFSCTCMAGFSGNGTFCEGTSATITPTLSTTTITSTIATTTESSNTATRLLLLGRIQLTLALGFISILTNVF